MCIKRVGRLRDSTHGMAVPLEARFYKKPVLLIQVCFVYLYLFIFQFYSLSCAVAVDDGIETRLPVLCASIMGAS